MTNARSAAFPFAAIALAMLTFGAACSKEPTRWDQAAQTAKSAAAADTPPAPPKTEGSSFNKFFPPDGESGAKRVFTQEKDGFAEAKLEKDGATMATLAISDAQSDDAAKKKFEGAPDTVATFPLVTVGKNQSAALVKGRYQVKVSSTTLDAPARKALLEKFDLAGLSKL